MLEWLGGEFDPDYIDIEDINEVLEDFEFYLENELETFENYEEGEDEDEESAEAFQDQLFDIVNEQMHNNDPPETAATFKRLINIDFSHLEAKMLISQCVSFELMSVVTEGKPFNMKRFIKHLNKLPKTDFK